ncbi:MAG: hypothetical protein QM765_12290 [Myxococcales bacterium]
MKRRLLRVLHLFAFEAALTALATAAGVHLLALGLWGTALLVLLVSVAGSAAGALVALRSGDLRMAWRCPRLDALALHADSADAPWEALVAADQALAALETAGTYREFFPEARRHLVQSAFRALAAYRLAERALDALREAPEGTARERLAAQEATARREVESLTAVLKDLKARIVAATAPVLEGDAGPELRELGSQTELLAVAIDDLHRAPEALPFSVPNRS